MIGVELLRLSPFLRGLSEAKKDPPSPVWRIGNELEALVRERLGAGRILVALGGEEVAADTEIPLRAGERVRVRVEQLHPRILLRLVPEEDGIRSHVTRLRSQRANPDGLRRLFEGIRTLREDFSQDIPRDRTGEGIVRAVSQRLESMVFSEKTQSNPLYVRDLVTAMGLLTERLLARAAAGGQDRAILNEASSGLKPLLMMLAEAMPSPAGADAEPAATAGAGTLREFLMAGIRSLEGQQIANVLLQELDGKYWLPIPMEFPGGLRMADLYIEGDRQQAQRGGDGRRHRVVLFLDMDALGRIMTDARLEGRRIVCHLACEREEIAALLTRRLEELSGRLKLLGYEEAHVSCDVRENIEGCKRAYLDEGTASSQESLNCFA